MTHAPNLPVGPARSRAWRVVAAFCLSACASTVTPADVVVIASGSDLESANPVVTVHPLARQVQRHVLFTPLVRLDSMLAPVPGLANTWTWNASRTVLTFALRDDLRWHDGQPVTARDVVVTLDALRDPATGAPRAGDLASVRDVAAPDDHTVRVTFAEPQPSLPLVFAEVPPVPAHRLADVPHEAWRRDPFSFAPIGNGPFRFVTRDAGRRWVFARNDDYPATLGGPPAMRELVVAVVDEAATKFAGLVSGELDLAGIAPNMADLVHDDPLLTLETPPVLFSTILAFNATRAPFDDVLVRRAVSLAIDRQRVVDVAVAGYAYPSASAVSPDLLPGADAFAQPPRAVARAAASALLAQAGWEPAPDGVRTRDGQRFAVTLLTVGTGDLGVEQLVQDDLRRVGIDVTIRPLELAAFLAAVRAPEKSFDVAYTGVPGDLAQGQLRALAHTSLGGGALDYTGYHDRLLDRALDSLQGATPDDRPAALARLARAFDAAMPVAWLYHARGVQGRRSSLGGVRMDLRGELATVQRWHRLGTTR